MIFASLRFWITENNLEYCRLGIRVTKHSGNAIERNKIKRWVRESFRQRRLHIGAIDVIAAPQFDSPPRSLTTVNNDFDNLVAMYPANNAHV